MNDSSDEDFNHFMQSLGGIRKLKQDRVDLLAQRPRKRHVKPLAPDRAQPGFETVPFSRHIPDLTADSWFHHGLQNKLQRKIRMGKLPVESILDLHGYRQHEALQQLTRFLQDALLGQAQMLLIIHGKGYNSQSESVLRPLVQHWLSEQTEVLAWCPAQRADGGHGASYVYLRRSQGVSD